MRVLVQLLPLLAVPAVLAQPGWEVEALAEMGGEQKGSGSTQQQPLSQHSYPGGKPMKMRLVNYEQRQLARRQLGMANGAVGKKSFSYLDMVRQRVRGAPTRPVQQAVPIAPPQPPPASSAAESRLPELTSLHKARELFETNKEGGPLDTLSELDIKADHMLQKSMQRTTVRTRTYPTTAVDADTNEDNFFLGTTTPLPATTSTAPVVPSSVSTKTPQPVSATPVLPVLQPAPFTLAPFPALPGAFVPPVVNLTQPAFVNPLGASPYGPPLPDSTTTTPSPPVQYEQLGCGFDLLTNSCKDVFGFGWCQSCEDFGNVFLHDCRCTARNNVTTLPSAAPTVPQLPGVPQPPLAQQQPPSPSGSPAIPNYFAAPRFFGYF